MKRTLDITVDLKVQEYTPIKLKQIDTTQLNITVLDNTVEVDLTGRDRQEYWVQLRVTNTELFSGFIEKPMLVEGDIPVLWNYQPVTIKQYNDLLERIEILEGGV